MKDGSAARQKTLQQQRWNMLTNPHLGVVESMTQLTGQDVIFHLMSIDIAGQACGDVRLTNAEMRKAEKLFRKCFAGSNN